MTNFEDIFEDLRPYLFRLAYSMLERVSLAEDAVQEAFIRWEKHKHKDIKSHKAYLSKIISRICLDELKSAKNRREQYIGPDLPEPVLTSPAKTPEEKIELEESLSMAMLHVLQKLSPVYRTVFMLKEVFEYDFRTIAGIVDKSEANCRKIAQRARDKVKNERPQFEREAKQSTHLVDDFLDAVREGNPQKIENKLAKDAVLYSDGGGKVTAARSPVVSGPKIARFLVGIQKQLPDKAIWSTEIRLINGEPGMLFRLNGELHGVWIFHIENQRIQSIYSVLNPEKLKHLKESGLGSKKSLDKGLGYHLL